MSNRCPSCGGILGRDCFNPVECAWISQNEDAQFGDASQQILSLESIIASKDAEIVLWKEKAEDNFRWVEKIENGLKGKDAEIAELKAKVFSLQISCNEKEKSIEKHLDVIAEITVEQMEEKKGMQWVKASECRPKEEERVICWLRNGIDIGIYMKSRINDGNLAFMVEEGEYFDIIEPEYWMPLPSDPSSQASPLPDAKQEAIALIEEHFKTLFNSPTAHHLARISSSAAINSLYTDHAQNVTDKVNMLKAVGALIAYQLHLEQKQKEASNGHS